MEGFASTTTMHGFGHVSGSKNNFGKVFYTCAVVTALGVACSQLVGVFNVFINQDMATITTFVTTTPELVIKNVNNLICPFNWLSHARTKQHNLTTPDVVALLSVLQKRPTYLSNVQPSQQYLDYLAPLSHHELIDLITLLAKPYSQNPNFNLSIMLSEGEVCFVSHKTHWYFHESAFVYYVELNTSTTDDHPVQKYDPVTTRQFRLHNRSRIYGIKFQHYAVDAPVLLWGEQLIDTPLETLNNNNVMYRVGEKVHSINQPGCKATSTAFQFHFSSAIADCVFKCVAQVVYYNRLKCRPAGDPGSDLPLCVWPQLIPNYENEGYDQWWPELAEETKTLVNDCTTQQKCGDQRHCTWFVYQINKANVRFIPVPSASKTFILGFAMEPVLTATKQAPMITGVTLLSNIGGTTGLWLGASMLSLIHLVYYWLSQLVSKIAAVKKIGGTTIDE